MTPARIASSGRPVFSQFPPFPVATLFTYMFLHGSWLHVVSNMWALWLFGDNVEDRIGHFRFACFYVVCGLLSISLHLVLNPSSVLPTIGASGAIAGVMGAYFLFYPTARMIVLLPVLFYPFFFEIPAAMYLLVWLALQLTSGTFALVVHAGDYGGVAFWAHVGGFVTGVALGWMWCHNPRGVGRCLWERDEYWPW